MLLVKLGTVIINTLLHRSDRQWMSTIMNCCGSFLSRHIKSSINKSCALSLNKKIIFVLFFFFLIFYLLPQISFAPRTTYQPVSARRWKPWRSVPCPPWGLSAASRVPRRTWPTPKGQGSNSHSRSPKRPECRRKPPPPLTAAACWPGHVLAQGPLPRCVTLCVSGSTLIHNKKAYYVPLATQCPSGVMALLCSLLPDRQVRCPGELGFSGGYLLGKVPRWTSLWNDVFCFSLKDKNRERPYFPQTTSRVSGNRASLTQGRNTLVNLLWWNHSLFSFFFLNLPTWGSCCFKCHGRAFRNILVIHPGRGLLSLPNI